MRTLLNAPRLNIIGGSFGTRITALYLQRYPDSSGRVVLDAPLLPGGNIESMQLGTVSAQQERFEVLLDACGTTLADCNRATVEDAFIARVNSLLENEDNEIFNAFYKLLLIALQDSETGEFLAPLLIDYAFIGDPTDMLDLIQQFGLGEDDDSIEGEDRNNSITLERAVICADDDARPDVESLISSLTGFNEISDLFAEGVLPGAASCVGWPEALDPVADISTTDAPVSLTIGGREDIFTPYNWAVDMSNAIGSVLLSSEHTGHSTLFVVENECVDSITVDFLFEGILPPEGEICE